MLSLVGHMSPVVDETFDVHVTIVRKGLMHLGTTCHVALVKCWLCVCNVAAGGGETGSPLPKPLDHLFSSDEDIGGGTSGPPPHIAGVTSTMTHNGDVRNLTFSPFGDNLAGGPQTEHVRPRNTQNSQVQQEVKVDSAGTRQTRLASTTGRVDFLQSAMFNMYRLLSMRETSRCGRTSRYNADGSLGLRFSESDVGLRHEHRCLAYSPSSRFLASGSDDMLMTVWDVPVTNSVKWSHVSFSIG